MNFRVRIRPFKNRLLLLLAILGPGIITANVDNDAGGITTYSVAGAHYGYGLMWMMPVVAIALDHHPGDEREVGGGDGQRSIQPHP